MSTTDTAIRLPALLPAIYREDAFLGRYLAAFESVLVDLETQIDGVSKYFDPTLAPAQFLPWLSSWMAFTARADLSRDQLSAFLTQVIPLYRRRGTLKNLQDLLHIFTVGIPTITERAPTFQIGVTATIGVDTVLGSDRPYYFRVSIKLPKVDVAVRVRQAAIASALIELEKPAHTQYDLVVELPRMQIGVASTIGVDTVLGTLTTDD